ncbi:uncharacterized protein LOC111245968 [Varroa destructor]|uniref:Uncharacterized protein n=1 Tax=Varroa destructor TaxID=109461 RepID=A0A7M7MBY0_VARDE|nr:uncharacterized protein LOC111245968 [Varroa destructor]
MSVCQGKEAYVVADDVRLMAVGNTKRSGAQNFGQGLTPVEVEQAKNSRERKSDSAASRENGSSTSSGILSAGNQDDSEFFRNDFKSYNSLSLDSSGSNRSLSESAKASPNGENELLQKPEVTQVMASSYPSSRKDTNRGTMVKQSSPNSSSESAMSYSSNEQSSSSGSDDDAGAHSKEHIKHPHHKASSKHRAMHSANRPSNSDSSMEQNVHSRSLKQRTHVSRKQTGATFMASGQSHAHKFPCTPSVCFEASLAAVRGGGPTRKLWEHRGASSLTLRDSASDAPSEEEITHMLALFTVTFLHSAFSPLVLSLRQVYLSCKDDAGYVFHMSWLIAYFMRLAAAMELQIQHTRAVLSVDLIGLLVFEATNSLQSINIEESGVKQWSLRRNYQYLVKALRELMISAVHFCYNNDILHIVVPLTQMEYLRHALVYFIRKPVEPQLAILSDAIVANHKLMLLMEWVNRGQGAKLDIRQHFQLFSARDVMDKYGDLLTNFRDNCAYVNHCILTMMEHVAVDLGHLETILTPKILCCFIELLNEPHIQLSESYRDFMNAMINGYLKLSRSSRSTGKCSGQFRSSREQNTVGLVTEDSLRNLTSRHTGIRVPTVVPLVAIATASTFLTDQQLVWSVACNSKVTVTSVMKFLRSLYICGWGARMRTFLKKPQRNIRGCRRAPINTTSP